MYITRASAAGQLFTSSASLSNTSPIESVCGASPMTRGRKKDLTIPPTRALVQQRDYRARRAHYVAELEARCRTAEEENVQLRKDLAAARASQTSAAAAPKLDPQTAQASSELMHNLSVASTSLARFQQIAFSGAYSPISLTESTAKPSTLPLLQSEVTLNGLRPASFPSPAPSPPSVYSTSAPVATSGYYPSRHKRLHREDSPTSSMSRATHNGDVVTSRFTRSPSLGPECCGGILDCSGLIEQDEDDASDGESVSASEISRSGSMPHDAHPASHYSKFYHQ